MSGIGEKRFLLATKRFVETTIVAVNHRE